MSSSTTTASRVRTRSIDKDVMTPQRFLVAAAFLGATALTGAGVAAAESTDSLAAPSGASNLLLTVNGAFVSNTSSRKDTLLTCNPNGGTHPHAADACSELAAAQGDFSKLHKKQQLCPMIYAPVTATATGLFAGKHVNFRQEFPNRCVLTRNTGQVFAF